MLIKGGPYQTWHCCPQSQTPPSLDAAPPLSEQCLHIDPEKNEMCKSIHIFRNVNVLVWTVFTSPGNPVRLFLPPPSLSDGYRPAENLFLSNPSLQAFFKGTSRMLG